MKVEKKKKISNQFISTLKGTNIADLSFQKSDNLYIVFNYSTFGLAGLSTQARYLSKTTKNKTSLLLTGFQEF